MDVYTVTRLNREARSLVEANFPTVWVEGEISNLARPRSGHVYFSLKDESAQVRCALFRMANRNPGFIPEDGARVLARGRASIYTQRGDFQLIVEYLEAAGEGALRQAFEILKNQLAAQGLFEPSHKKPLPAIPKRIGVITSPSGAAIRDVLAVLKRRFPGIPVLVYPASVQGREAVPEITRGLDLASRRRECDVLILTRGGGSLEDLQAFNEEAVAHAVYRCEIPIISAVGHEIDFTIADFTADRRAPTPSAAAELVVPDRLELQRRIAAIHHRMLSLARHRFEERRREVLWLEKQLAHPKRRLSDGAQRIDDSMDRLIRHMRAFPSLQRGLLSELTARVHRCAPWARIQAHGAHREQLTRRLFLSVQQRTGAHASRVDSLRRTLDAMDPKRTLERGYAIVTGPQDGKIVLDAQSLSEGDRIHAGLAKGSLLCTVVEVESEAEGS